MVGKCVGQGRGHAGQKHRPAHVLGKARNTVYLWYRQGTFPPPVDVGPYLHVSKPVIVVHRYRLEAWLAREQMPSILQEVFDYHVLHEPPWGCWTAKKGAAAQGHRLLGEAAKVDDRTDQGEGSGSTARG
jgi:hypothetical protein